MEKQEYQFPTEEVILPSKGLLYPKDHPLSKGVIEIKYMTAREEDILTNQNYITNGTVIDKLLQSLIVTQFDYGDLLIGDKNAVLVACRILGYGASYDFDYKGEKVSVDLATLNEKEIDEKLITPHKNEFNFNLPFSKKEVTFKLITHKEDTNIQNELKGLKKINKRSSAEITTRLKHTILSIDGNYEKKDIREFVDNQLLARDARALRTYINEIQPDSDLTFEREASNGDFETLTIPITANFFWPDVEL